MKKIYFLFGFLFCVVAFAQDGSLDLDFVVEESISPLRNVKIQSDGKILLLEQSYEKNGIYYPSTIKRLNENGTVDGSFNICTLGGNNGYFMPSLIIQPDGKIIIFGFFTSLNSIPMTWLARLNQDGSLDTSFDTNTQIDGGYIASVAIQSDGKIIVAGSFSSYKGVTRHGVVRLNYDGSLDFTFYPIANTSQAPTIDSVIIHDDGKILVSGQNYFSGTWEYMARLNSNGSIDNSFIQPFLIPFCPWECYPISMILQQDQKIIIGGELWVYNDAGLTQLLGTNMARLNTDGTVESCFYTDSSMLDGIAVYPSSLQQDGKIIIRGNYPDYNGSPINRLARLNSDGSLDSSFNIGTGPNGEVYNTEIQPDGKIIITGNFTEYNGIPRNRIARINGQTLSLNDYKKANISFFPNPVKDLLHLNLPDAIVAKEYEIYDLVAKKITLNSLNKSSINVSDLSSGVYILKVKTDNEVLTTKFIKE